LKTPENFGTTRRVERDVAAIAAGGRMILPLSLALGGYILLVKPRIVSKELR
jgi:hypothetical protein